MAARPQTPSNDAYGSVPPPGDAARLVGGYGVLAQDHANLEGSVHLSQTQDNPIASSPLSQSMHQSHYLGKFDEDFNASRPTSSAFGQPDALHRPASSASETHQPMPSRSGTLKKKNSLKRKSSLRRSSSKRSLRAGSIKGVNLHSDGDQPEDYSSAFFTPIPTSGSPTDILVNRFQGELSGLHPHFDSSCKQFC